MSVKESGVSVWDSSFLVQIALHSEEYEKNLWAGGNGVLSRGIIIFKLNRTHIILNSQKRVALPRILQSRLLEPQLC